MKKATISTTINGRPMIAWVTVDQNQKVSISIMDSSSYSISARYQLKSHVNKIVALNFKHEDVSSFIEDIISNSLIEILKKETESLRLQFLQKTEDWARKDYARAIEMKKMTDVEWCKWLGIEPQMSRHVCASTMKTYLTFPENFYNTKDARRLRNMKSWVYSTTSRTLDSHIESELKYAEIHYETSIYKLASRISKKGLDQTKLSVKTSHIGVNIDTVLTDGVLKVKAFTIIAEGEIIRPHYRYLIK
jgi:hypothetical protein